MPAPDIAALIRATRASQARSPPNRALRVDVKRIKRVARRHEQAVALEAAEADIGAALGQRDRSDALAFGVEHHDAIAPLPGAPTAPQIAIDIAAVAVGS